MTGVYVNHEDIRQFLFNLGKEPTQSGIRLNEALEHVSSCFGLPFMLLHSRCRVDGPASPHGLPLTRNVLLDLGESVMAHDMTRLKNTKRLEIVAGAFGWKPDAFMHHLKSTTAGLGRNETMLPAYKGVRFPGLADIDSGPTIPFMFSHIAKSTGGLFLFAGPTGSGKSTTLQMTVREIPEERSIVVIEPGVDQSMPTGEKPLEIAAALRRSPADYLIIPEIRDTESAIFALQMAETMVVLTTSHAISPLSAVQALHLRAAGFPLDTLRGAYCQHLVRSAPGVKRSRTVLCDMLAFGDDEAQDAAARPMGSDHMYGIYADAAAKIAKGEIEERTVHLGFGSEFQEYLNKRIPFRKTTSVKDLPHTTPTKIGDLKLTADWPIETFYYAPPSRKNS